MENNNSRSQHPSTGVRALDPFSHDSVMAMDVYRRGPQSRIDIDVPGIDPSTIRISLRDSVLLISAQRARRDFGYDDIALAERQHGAFARELVLSPTIAAEQLKFSCERGVLSIEVTDPCADENPVSDTNLTAELG